MKNVFLFFRSKSGSNPQLERDFRSAYQEPSLGYLQLAFVLGIISFAGFLVMDFAHGTVPAMPGVSFARVTICILYLLGLTVTALNRQFVARHYTPIVNVFMSLGMLGAALLPIAIHGNSSNLDIYWSLNSSLTTGAIVIYGTSRLTARNTALIVIPGCLLGIGTALRLPDFDWYQFGRLVFHLIFVNLAAFSLRETVENNERSLFLLARENLSRNVYAKELEAARAQAEEGNEIKLRFLANMSHEFRTPMNGVIQTLEIAARSANKELADLIERARRSGQALLATLNGILEYTRWTQRGLVPDEAFIGLSDSIRQAVRHHEDFAREKGLTLVLRLDLMGSDDAVRVDKLMLDEVVGRLVDNAIRFTRSGHVRVGVELISKSAAPYSTAILEVSVADSGVGIPDGLHEAIYEPFYQVETASDRSFGGTGLGLAIVRRLVDAMRGEIRITSRVGIGSTFLVRLPVEFRKSPTRSDAPSTPSRTRRSLGKNEPLRGTVLLAEDNELNAALAVELLTLLGLDVTLTADGEQAHHEAERRSFDVILMDCQMPRVDGYEATRRIREAERVASKRRVPIIAVTANALAGDREKCLGAGMDDYLAKPYTVAQMRAMLVAWLPERLDASTAGSALPSSLDSALPPTKR